MTDDSAAAPAADSNGHPDQAETADPTSDTDPDRDADSHDVGRAAPTHASVRATYERIAEHFSRTRATAWPDVEAFLSGRSGSVGLDIGCGNGRHLELLDERCERAVGVDQSPAMLATARERAAGQGRGFELLQGDAGRLPVATEGIDLAVYIATLPHLTTRERRLGSLDELARVLDPDGRALVSAWSTEHERFDSAEGFDAAVPWTLPDGETVDRFYHIYDPDEFRVDVRESALELLEFELASGNCYGVVAAEAAASNSRDAR
jgi:tRNA (uracil-5-)-methyltransferase TRM9